MDFIRTLFSRCSALFGREKLDADLDEELQAHLDLAVEENLKRGMSREQARRMALRDFGGVTQIKESYRSYRGLPFLEILAQDVRYALRQLGNSLGFTLTAVLTLALGIGANTAIFTLVHGILLRSLPVSDPSRLYRIGDRDDCCYYDTFQNDDGDFDLFSYDLYLHLKQSAAEFEQLAAVQAGGGSYSVRYGNVPAKPMRSEYVSGNYFDTLGVGAYAGRPLNERDDMAGAAPTLVLSYKTWQTDFAADPEVIGSTIYVQLHPFTVAGVAPPGFFGDRVSTNPPDFWMPLATEPLIEGSNSAVTQVDEDWLYPLGRVRPGVNMRALQAKLSGVLQQWLQSRPRYTDNGGAALVPRQHVILAPAGGGIQKLQEQTGAGLRLLMTLSAVVLLIACANIANLLLARCTARRSDVAVRIALGAARGRLIRQILTESVLLSLIGGVAGVAVAYAGSHAMLTLAFPNAKNMPIQATPSLPVLGFTFFISLLTGIVFGTAPAWLSSHTHPADALRGANRSAGERSSMPQRGLVIVQVALSVVLLAGAFLMSKSLRNLEHQDFGIATANRYVLEFDPKGVGYTLDRLPALYREVEDRFSALPGIAHVSLVRYIPLGGNMWGSCVIPQGHSAPGPKDNCFAVWDRASADFMQSIGVRIIRGRNFTAQDAATTQLVAIVNPAFARQFFPNQDAVGKHFGVGLPQYSETYEVAGVFADFKMTDPRQNTRPLFFLPLTQRFTGLKEPEADAAEMSSMFMRFIILDFTQPPPDADALARKILAEIDPNLPVIRFTTYDSELAGNFNQDRLIARLSSLFGALALVLATVGLYGVMSYMVTRRTTEIGVRMSLGATRLSIVGMVLRGALLEISIGLLLGIPFALTAGHLMRNRLYGVSAYDPTALIASISVLALCAAAAGFIPAQRAASIDPIQALRSE